MDEAAIDAWRERAAHALTPWEWRGRSLALGIVALIGVVAVAAIQRVLVAEGAAAIAVSVVLGVVWVGFAGALAWRAVREWKRRRPVADEP